MAFDATCAMPFDEVRPQAVAKHWRDGISPGRFGVSADLTALGALWAMMRKYVPVASREGCRLPLDHRPGGSACRGAMEVDNGRRRMWASTSDGREVRDGTGCPDVAASH
ncbi:hypothetical protein [Streptomyces sp. NPDC127072]|uniref:hypothetical protein n=1 Tax=Streptomyces sp. NPDC127072 TaxID=3347129 RepID=UPI00364BAE56